MLTLHLVFRLSTLDKVLVQGHNSAYKEPLNCILWNTFNLQWQKNSTYELQFTAYNNGSIGYELLGIEGSVFFDGQEYVIKNLEPDFTDGFETNQITATHIYNEISRIRQRNTRAGELTYLPKDVLAYYLAGNTQGFTYETIGTFDSQQITDLGNSSGADMLSTITDTWTDCVIYPDNKNIRVYSADAFAQNLGNRVDYANDTTEIDIQYDSTELVNQLWVSGKEKDSDSDSDTTSYYFAPHLVTDQASVDSWGLHPGDDLSDDRFTISADMDAYALTQMTPDPTLEVDATMSENGKPVAGEMRRLEIRQTGYITNLQVDAYTWYPFDETQQTSLTLNSTGKNILDYQASKSTQLTKELINIKNSITNISSGSSGSGDTKFTWTSTEVSAFDNS